MRGIADKAWAAGWNVVRLNQRNCGGTEHLSRGLYHSGLTARSAVRHARADRARRPAGDRGRRLLARRQPGAEARRRARRRRAAAAARPSAPCRRRWTWRCACDALERRANIAYQWNFVRNLKARMRRKAAALPGRLLARAAAARLDGAPVRRGLHRAAPRLPRRRRLLPSRQRAARGRSHPRAGADPDGRGRPVRARRRRSAIPRSPAIPHITTVVTRARRPLRVRRAARTATTTATGPSAKSSGSSAHASASARDCRHQQPARTPAPSLPLRA